MGNGWIISLIILVPLLGGVMSYITGVQRSRIIAVAAIALGSVLSAFLLLSVADLPLSYRWDWVPGVRLGWHIDHTTVLLVLLVYFISLLVHLFSVYYMAADVQIHRYYAKLGFFTTSMLGLLLADHLVLLFVFWELVGFSSYLLIGFWYEDVDKSRAAREAFMINRVADAGLLIGIILVVFEFDQPYLSELAGLNNSTIAHLAGFGLLIGALGKSAQFPFYGWLPKAMAGPTPVSALIHAATMVAAGVYLLIRTLPLLTELVLLNAAAIGCITAFLAGTAALFQHDIKKVLAYSTISQLGYMVMGIGVGAYQSSLFHLWTHAFFKAGLFLGAGAVIHYYHHLKHNDPDFNPQDMRNMGGLRSAMPYTHIAFVICALALAGLPFFSGFLSKEGILTAMWGWSADQPGGALILTLAFGAAFLTPLYIGRQVLLVFYGSPKTALMSHGREEPWLTVRVPLILLALGSLWIFNALNPLDADGWWFNEFLFPDVVSPDHSGGLVVMIVSIVLAVLGLLLAYFLFKPGSPYRIQESYKGLVAKSVHHGWYMEYFYEMVSKRYLQVTKATSWTDRKAVDRAVDFLGVFTVVFSKVMAIIDREIVDGLVRLTANFFKTVGTGVTRIHSPSLQSQLAWMVVVLLAILIWFQF